MNDHNQFPPNIESKASLSHRLLSLDSLRGLAAIGVAVYHYTFIYDRHWNHVEVFTFRFPYGAWGVQVFFIISGFVILMSLERSHSASDFAAKRFFRLYPAYWTAIALTFFIVNFFHLPGREVSLKAALVNLTMLQGVFGIQNVDGPYWTLQVELCFYILMGAIYALKLQKWLFPLLFVIAALGMLNVNQGWLHEWPGVWRLERAWPLRSHLPFFMFGICLYRIRCEGFNSKSLLELFVTLPLVWWCTSLPIFLSVLPLTTFVILSDPIWLKRNPFLFLGKISYSLYLIHAGIGYVIIRECYRIGLSPTYSIPLALTTSLILATLITYLVEIPANRYLRSMWNQYNAARKSSLEVSSS